METQVGAAPVAGAYSGYSLHGEGPEGINLILSHPGISCSRVTRLSPTAVWALPEPGAPLPQRERVLQVLLDGHGLTIGPLRGETLWSDSRRLDAPIGIQLQDVSLTQGRQILSLLDEATRNGKAEPAASPLPIQETLSDPERIRAVLQAVCTMRHQGTLRRLGRTVRVALERFDEETGRLYWRGEEPEVTWGPGPYDIEVLGHNSAYRLRVPALELREERLVTPLPKRMWQVRHRWHRRAPAPAGLRARFHHPLWNELGVLEREAVDLSFAGLALRNLPEDLVFPGLVLQEIEVETAEGECIRLRGEVRYVADRHQEARVCGLQVTPCTPLDEARWMHLVSQALCPTTRGSGELLEPLWQLYIDSGYFNLAGKSAEYFEELRASFIEVGRSAERLPRLFCQTVWPSERGVEATFSAMRPYRHGWMLHQLAKRLGKPTPTRNPAQVLRDIHVRTLEHAQSDPDFRWLVAYAEATVPLVERLHLRFAQAHVRTGDALLMPVRMMDVYCDEPSGLPADAFQIGPASHEEKQRLVEEIARTRPASYVDALDFTRDRLELRGVAAAWREGGLERERHILVARRDGVALAALVLELGHLGTNLFRLLDAARLFPLAPEGREAYVALLDEARRWYARRGRSSFLFLREEEDDGTLAAARMHDDPGTRPRLWLLSAKRVPEFLEYLNEATVGRRRPASRAA